MTKDELNKLVVKNYKVITLTDALAYAWNLAIEAAAAQAKVITTGTGEEEFGAHIVYDYEVDKDSIQKLKI